MFLSNSFIQVLAGNRTKESLIRLCIHLTLYDFERQAGFPCTCSHFHVYSKRFKKKKKKILQRTGCTADILQTNQVSSVLLWTIMPFHCSIRTFLYSKNLPVLQCLHLWSKERNIAYPTEAICDNYCGECCTISLFHIYKLEPTFYFRRKKHYN